MSGPSSTTTVPAPTQQDVELQNLNIASAQKQSLGQAYQYAMAAPSQALQYLNAVQSGQPVPAGLQTMFGGLESLSNPDFITQLQTQQQTVSSQQQLSNLTTQQAIKYASGDTSLNPQQQGLVDQAFAGPQQQAQYDLNTAMQGNAGARGLNLSDSPVANENARQTNLLNLNFGSAKANTALNLGLAQENANLAYSQFSAGLNPGQYTQMSSAQAYSSPNLASGMAYGLQQQAMQPTTQQSYGALDYLGTGAKVAQGVGSAMYGYGASDRRLKSNIVRIGTHTLGIGIYEYDIYNRHEQGVMADEVLTVKPGAVMIDDNGYYMVDYSQL